MSNSRECFLLLGHRHTLKDTVVAAADGIFLVTSKMGILGNDDNIVGNTARDTDDGFCHIHIFNGSGSFDDGMADTVTKQNLDRNLGVILYFVCQVNDRPGNSVRHLIGMGGIYFFKHSEHLSC